MTEGEKLTGPAPDFEKLLNSAVEPILKRLDSLEQTEKQFNASIGEEIKTLKADKIAGEESKAKDRFSKLLNAASLIDLDKIWAEAKPDVLAWTATHPDKLMNAAPAETELTGKLLNADGSEFNLAAEQAKVFGY
jgi:hypothetical protein